MSRATVKRRMTHFCLLHTNDTIQTMKGLSPLAQKYKDAFDGYMFVFDIDGASETRLVMHRHSLVVLDGHPS